MQKYSSFENSCFIWKIWNYSVFSIWSPRLQISKLESVFRFDNFSNGCIWVRLVSELRIISYYKPGLYYFRPKPTQFLLEVRLLFEERRYDSCSNSVIAYTYLRKLMFSIFIRCFDHRVKINLEHRLIFFYGLFKK